MRIDQREVEVKEDMTIMQAHKAIEDYSHPLLSKMRMA